MTIKKGKDHLLEILRYGRESLQVDVFHRLTNNKFKQNLKLLMPLSEINQTDNKYHDYSGSDLHTSQIVGVNTIGHGSSQNAFGNGLLGTDEHRIMIPQFGFGTNDFTVMFVADVYDGDTDQWYLFETNAGSSNRLAVLFRESVNRFQYQINNNFRGSSGTNDRGLHLYAIRGDRDGNFTFHADLVEYISVDMSGDSAIDMTLDDWEFYQREQSNTNQTQMGMKWIIAWDRLLSDEELAELQVLLKPRRFDLP